MMILSRFSRRRFIAGGALTLGGLLTASCDRLSAAPDFQQFVGSAEGLTLRAQRLLLAGQPLAREFSATDMSPTFRSNGSTMPADPAYRAMMDQGFSNWRLRVDGLVSRPLTLSLSDLRAMPQRSQITRHDCVEGWSAIGQWTGTQLSLVLLAAGIAPKARYVVFHCADDLEQSTDGSGLYYESIDLIDAFHPQTILATDMNGQPLAVEHGAPLRMRIERQLGYKHAKYVMHIEVVDSMNRFGMGRGGYWEDRGYEWYAGI
jgi:DMSO/TMAO reductase YedYZ molybdopterin-dependent catalytic subunit